MLWEIDIYPAPGQSDRLALEVAADAAELGIASGLHVVAAAGYLLQGRLERPQVERLARELFADRVVEQAVVSLVGEDPPVPPADLAGFLKNFPLGAGQGSVGPNLTAPPQLVHVLSKPGVMDPVAQSAQAAIADFGLSVEAVRTLRKFWLANLPAEKLPLLAAKVLANDAIEQVVIGSLKFDRLELGSDYAFLLVTVPLRDMDDAALRKLSRIGQLFLSLDEMQTIQAHFRQLGRDPTDAELETLAQTWSEHCSHKTLAGRIAYTGPFHGPSASVGCTNYASTTAASTNIQPQSHHFENMLKETIFAATQKIRAAKKESGQDDWCVSVFQDNAGVVKFDDQYHVVFKVETHNHPSALEPYGGANTGLGGVIRDSLGTGLGAKPVASTDVFCFAPPDTPADTLPPGVLHPRRVMKGVVAGVRDYGNRMGIPTVNGAIYFDSRYLGNPLVFCGNVGLLPVDKSHKQPQSGDLIVAIGGRTGRDGIHGATFSSAELTSDSETLSGGAVQIGNAITEKMLLDVVLQARDRGLYTAITDCGAGGFSSAVGEMGAELGAYVWLDRVPLKYTGLSYTEIWISEAQERMVLSVPPANWPELKALCELENVGATAIGEFRPTGLLQLFYNDQQVAELSMQFLHDGRPPVVRTAVYTPSAEKPLESLSSNSNVEAGLNSIDHNNTLLKILSSLNVCSKEWVIRQYDHEVLGGSVIKPLVGIRNDGPSDAAVLRPVLNSHRGIVISCGMNPRYADFDAYHTAASAIDEAVRNCIAVGADPQRIAILDNFCWGDCEQPETLGSLVRAACACHDVAVALGTPFISGKDSLNNEFRFTDATGEKRGLAIPPSLLISALGQVDDVRRCVTMDVKRAGNILYQVGATKNELGGSHFALVNGLSGGHVPQVDVARAKATFAALHAAIHAGCVHSCHDLSEGGLAAAAAEMAFAGGLGARLYLLEVPHEVQSAEAAEVSGGLATVLLFAESNSRFLVEVSPEYVGHFEALMGNVPHAAIGEVTAAPQLRIVDVDPATDRHVVELEVAALKSAWQKPLMW
ncbi:MAG TPA: phosphoribosylformylglycinamidine synthase subunit PurL [Pirellulales bacterium]|jgi:phosphoribosylformylglycinamidine synthase|nr:phosphoribosylformylglycinamidine synthase subunit PurL [Pirellulales bacterium]